MVAFAVLVLLLLLLGGFGFVAHLLWIVLVIALAIWLVGFLVGETTDGRRGWYRW
jgi:hypothetical protein